MTNKTFVLLLQYVSIKTLSGCGMEEVIFAEGKWHQGSLFVL
jgi:hypothetical protein